MIETFRTCEFCQYDDRKVNHYPCIDCIHNGGHDDKYVMNAEILEKLEARDDQNDIDKKIEEAGEAPEMVHHPDHYAKGRDFEPKDVIRDWELNFNLGSAVKYLARAGRKGDIIEDLMKAKQYIDFEIEALKEE